MASSDDSSEALHQTSVLARRLRKALEPEGPVLVAYLHGGPVKRVDELPASTVTLTVFTPPTRTTRDEVRLRAIVREAAQPEDLDVVFLDEALLDEVSPLLAWTAINGLRVFERDEGGRVVLEVAAMSRYLDHRERERKYAAWVAEFAAEGCREGLGAQ